MIGMDIIQEAKSHLEKLRMETSYSHEATMPIPTYEATKDLIFRLVDRLEKLEGVINSTLDAVKAYPEHPMTASEVNMRNVMYKAPSTSRR